jgi:hypothetical protein
VLDEPAAIDICPEPKMKRVLKSIIAAPLLIVGVAPAVADRAPAYAVFRVRTTPEQRLFVRFPSLPACRRDLPRLKALMFDELQAPATRRFDVVPPEAVPGNQASAPHIDGACRPLPVM